jgi:hypothetical protein
MLAADGFRSLGTARLLVFGSHRVDRFVEFALGGMEMLFGLGAMALHIVVVRGAGMIHLFDGFFHVVMDRVEVVPVVNFFGKRDSGNKRQTRGNYGTCNRFGHNFPFEVID